MYAKRLVQVQSLLSEYKADAALLTFLPDIRWVCGFTGSNALLVICPDQVHFISDGRYITQARNEVQGAVIHTPGYDLRGHVQSQGLLGAAHTILVQGDHMAIDALDAWQQLMPGLVWLPVNGLLQEVIATKEPEEIECIRAAQRITDTVFTDLLPLIKPGVSERELAAEIVYRHLQQGAEAMSFEPIVASGIHGALPHARSTDRCIQSGDMVTLDFGCFYNGYASDMTRTVAVGEPGDAARRIYQVVLQAQQAAIAGARSGMASNELDKIARDLIEKAGYGSYFSHSLGHGLGLQIHEWPGVSYRCQYRLPERAAVTIEPGIYIPDQLGVRIEDIVILLPEGCEVITQSPKNLIVL